MKFTDLTPEAQDRAIEKNADINTGYDWWNIFQEEPTWFFGFDQQEAERIRVNAVKFKLAGQLPSGWKPAEHLCEFDTFYFDLGQRRSMQWKDIGIACWETLACLADADPKVVEDAEWTWHYSSNKFSAEPECADEDIDTDICDELLRAVTCLNDKIDECWHILDREHDYLTSEEAIRETLIANDYDFDEDGCII
jgi:hypothetical protein